MRRQRWGNGKIWRGGAIENTVKPSVKGTSVLVNLYNISMESNCACNPPLVCIVEKRATVGMSRLA